MRKRHILLASLAVIVFVFLVVPLAVNAVSSATISFLDSSDQPQYQATGSNPVDESGGCDIVSMMMTDATGQITDIDTFCMDATSGIGVDYTDWGSYASGYVATQGPVTYTLYDTAPGDACYNDENSLACGSLLLSGSVACVGENYYQPSGLPAGTPYRICGAATTNVSCPNPLPDGSTVRSVPAGALAYFEPSLDAYTGFNLPPGTWYVSETSGDFAKVWIACQAESVWIPVANIAN